MGVPGGSFAGEFRGLFEFYPHFDSFELAPCQIPVFMITSRRGAV